MLQKFTAVSIGRAWVGVAVVFVALLICRDKIVVVQEWQKKTRLFAARQGWFGRVEIVYVVFCDSNVSCSDFLLQKYSILPEIWEFHLLNLYET